MGLFTPTGFFYQPPPASAGGGAAYKVRTDAYASYLKVAVPGTKFTDLGMSNFYDSIDSVVRGNGSNFSMTPTGAGTCTTTTTVNNNTYDFSASGYTTAISTSGAMAALYTAASNLVFGSSDFVIEGYFNFQQLFAFPPYNNFIFGEFSGGYMLIDHNGSAVRMYINNSNKGVDDTYTTGAWQHWAFVRSGTNIYIYKNGTRIASSTYSGDIPAPSVWQGIGYNNTNDNAGKYTQDFKIYIGTDKGYTGSTITVPQSIVIPV